MKKRIVFILIAILICAGAAAFVFVPYTPMPDADSFQNVSIWRIRRQRPDRNYRSGRSNCSAGGTDAGAGEPCAVPEAQLFDG